MTLDRFFQHVLPRDIARAWQDSSAPVAETLAQREPETMAPYRPTPTPDIARAMAAIDTPIAVSLAALRACRPDMEDAPPPDTAAIVDTLLRHVTAGWTLTARGKQRVRDGIVRGLVEAGVVR